MSATIHHTPITSTAHDTPITIRPAGHEDGAALRRLAQLDGARLLDGDLLVAEVDGEIRAALRVSDRAYIADPFHPTRELVGLLDVRAGLLRREHLSTAARARTRLAHWSALWQRASEAHPTA